MKTKISVLSLAVLAMGGMFLTSCGGEDLSTPVIVLNGDDPFIVELGDTYTDPGFTATDDEDGDVSALVTVDDSDVDTEEIGEYTVEYSVTDEAGNVGTATRTVRVVMGKADYLGTYQVHEICDMDGDGVLGEPDVDFEINDYTVTVTSGGDENELLFDNFGAYEVIVPVYFEGDLNEILVVDDYLVPGAGVYFNANGEITTGTTSDIEFSLDYSAEDGPVVVPCEATFEKL